MQIDQEIKEGNIISCIYTGIKNDLLIAKKNMNIFSPFKKGLQKTSNFLSKNILDSIIVKKINQETLDELESVLISADISLEVTSKLIECVQNIKLINENNTDQILNVLAEEISLL